MFDRAEAQALDVSIGTAATAVRAAFGGDDRDADRDRRPGLTEIEVHYPLADQNILQDVIGDADALGKRRHRAPRRRRVLRIATGAADLTRQDRAQVIHIRANMAPGYELSNVTNAFLKQVAALHLPRTVTIRRGGAGPAGSDGPGADSAALALAISIMLVFLLIVALYNSYRTPFVIAVRDPGRDRRRAGRAVDHTNDAQPVLAASG